MTLAAFQGQFSFKFLPKTVIGKFWWSQCARQRVPDRWSTHMKGARTGSHCSCPRYICSQFQMRCRTQKPTSRNRRNSDAVIGEVDGCATMETFVDQGGHLECHSPATSADPSLYRCDVIIFLGAKYEPCRSILHTLQPVHQAFTDTIQQRVAVV